MEHDVFICHASEDRAIANAICSHLERNRIRCWIAPRDVVPGSDYAQSIVEAIASTKLTVLLFSHSSNHSPHVKREIERSVSHGIPILPFRVEDVVPSPSLEYFISDSHWLDAVTPPMEEHLEYLAGTVRMLLDRAAAGEAAAAPPVGEPPAAPQTSPTPVPAPVTPSPGRSRPRWLVPAAAAAVVVVAVVVGVVIALGGADEGDARQTSPTASVGGSRVEASEPAPDEPEPPGDTGSEPESEFLEEFDGALEEGWTWVNEDPGAWRLVDGWLEIDAAPSPPVTNLLLRDLPDDTSALTTYLSFLPSVNYQFAGIVLAGDDPANDRIQFGRAFCDNEWCVGDGLYLDVFEGGELVSTGEGTALEDIENVFIALDITGDTVTALYSFDGQEDFQVAGIAPANSSHTRIGLAAHQAPIPVTAGFEYVILTDW